jgi:3'(2'), 5'-bisphosphate nucleotidase
VVAEEAASHGNVPRCGRAFFLVDPLDGTKEFLRANGEFTVNLALVDGGVPVAGAVFAPAIGRLWYGGRHAFACEVQPGAAFPGRDKSREIHVRTPSADGLVVLESRSHPEPRTEDFLKGLRILERRKAGSSLKFCLLAEGGADLYPRFGPTMEWDTAAGDAVLRAAGGIVLATDGQPLAYAKEALGFRNPDFIAWGARTAETVR